MSFRKLTTYFFLVGIASYLLGLITAPNDDVADRHIQAQQAYIYYLENHIPTFREFQKKVGAEQDGIIGKDTLEKWDKAICQQAAIESMNRMARGKEKK